MFVSLLLIAVVVVTIVMQYRQYKSFKDALAEYERGSKKKMKVTKMTLKDYFMGYGMGAICLLMGLAIFVKPDLVAEGQQTMYIISSLCIAFMFVSTMFLAKNKLCLYYDNEGFFSDDKYIRYSSVKSITKKSGSFSSSEIHLFNGEKMTLSSNLANLIIVNKEKNKEKEKEKETRKDNRKEKQNKK